VPRGSGQAAGWPLASEPMTTRNNSLLVARSRQPMQVRMGTRELSVMVTTGNSIA
jgi:hypothetical protein